MNFMCHVSECDFEGATMLKLSEKQQFWQVFAIFWKKQGKAQKFGRGGLFSFCEIQKFARNWPNMQKLNRQMAEIWPKSVNCDN